MKHVVLQINILVQHKSHINACACLCIEIEVCELTAERHRLQEQLRSALEQQQRTSSSLQLHVNSLQQERDTAKVHTYSQFFFQPFVQVQLTFLQTHTCIVHTVYTH